jgi:hypothetical protein
MPLKLFAGVGKDPKTGKKLPPVEVPSDASPGVVKVPPADTPKRGRPKKDA